MSKSEATDVDRLSRYPARPPASQYLRDGQAREETSLVSSFRRLASCFTESAGSGQAERRKMAMRRGAVGGAGGGCPFPASAVEKLGLLRGRTALHKPVMYCHWGEGSCRRPR